MLKALAGVAAAALAGCASQAAQFRTAYEQIEVGRTIRAEVDRLFPDGPVRPDLVETFVAGRGDPYMRLAYTHNAPQGVVISKHLLAWRDQVGKRQRTLTLEREGVVQPEEPARYRAALRARNIDPLIDLLAPDAGTLTSVLNETPLVRPEYGKVVSIRDEFRPDVPDPPPGERHLPSVYLYTRRGQMPDFNEAHLGFGRWTLLTKRGDLHSAFFVPGRIFPGSGSYQRAFVDDQGYLTFAFHFQNYGETVNTLVAVKEDPPGTFLIRYTTVAEFVRHP